jgi:hypothetical protein
MYSNLDHAGALPLTVHVPHGSEVSSFAIKGVDVKCLRVVHWRLESQHNSKSLSHSALYNLCSLESSLLNKETRKEMRQFQKLLLIVL